MVLSDPKDIRGRLDNSYMQWEREKLVRLLNNLEHPVQEVIIFSDATVIAQVYDDLNDRGLIVTTQWNQPYRILVTEAAYQGADKVMAAFARVRINGDIEQ